MAESIQYMPGLIERKSGHMGQGCGKLFHVEQFWANGNGPGEVCWKGFGLLGLALR